jgi:hypothetical protein
MPQTGLKATTLIITIMVLLTSASTTYGQTEYELSASLELGSNSKVVVDELDLVNQTGDTYSILGVAADMKYEIEQGRDISAGYSYKSKRYTDFDQFDLDTHLLSLAYGHKWQGLNFDIALRHADAQLDGQDFLTLTQLSPSVATFISKKHYLRGSYTNIDKTLNNRPQRDATADQFSLDYYFFSNGLNSYWIAGIKNRSEDAGDQIYDYTGFTYRLAYKFRDEVLDKPTQYTLDYRYRNRDYDESINPELQAFRSDSRDRLTISAKTDLSKELELVLEARYIKNNSNLSRLNYNESIVSVAMQYNFLD